MLPETMTRRAQYSVGVLTRAVVLMARPCVRPLFFESMQLACHLQQPAEH